MVTQKTHNYKSASLWFALVLSFGIIQAQTFNDLFDKKYYKWGITGQFNTFKAADMTETPNNPHVKFSILKSQSMAVGLKYNFYQHKNWNFKIGLQVQWFGNAKETYIDKEESILDFDYGRWSMIESDILVYLPVTAEYIFLKTGSIYFSMGAGLALTYYPYDKITGSLFIYDSSIMSPEDQVFETTYYNSKNPFYGSAHLEGNIYFKSKSFILQTGFVYNKSFKAFRTGNYTFMNLQQSENVNGTINQSGDY